DRSESPRYEILSRKLDAIVARRSHHVRLHVLARGASSRPDFDAGAPTRLPHPRQNSRCLALGETLETGWPNHTAALSRTCPLASLLISSGFPAARKSLQELKPA